MQPSVKVFYSKNSNESGAEKHVVQTELFSTLIIVKLSLPGVDSRTFRIIC